MIRAFAARLFLFTTICTTPIVRAQLAYQNAGTKEYNVGDYTIRMLGNGQAGQMRKQQRPVGTIYTANGQMMFAPVVPEPEASAAKKAFEDWKSGGQTGSTAPPATPTSFGPDGSAVVPLEDGTIVTFTPTDIQVNSPNALASIPGQAPVTNVKFQLKGPGVGGIMFGSHTGIFINGNETKDYVGFGNGGRKSGKQMYFYLKPLLEGPVTKAAERAANDPHKPANALDYQSEIPPLIKRVE